MTQAIIAMLAVVRVCLYRQACDTVEMFYFNMAMLSYDECCEIRRIIFVEGCRKLVDHISVDASVMRLIMIGTAGYCKN